MSFGGFQFGSNPAASSSTPSSSVPSFSLTPAQPNTTSTQPAASSPFSFGGAATSSAPTPGQTQGQAGASSPFSFGSTSTSQPAAGTATGQSGGLFGAAPTSTSAGGQAAGSGLFGGGGGGTGLFGAKPATPAAGGSGQGTSPFSFGQPSQTQQQPAQQTSLFGSTTTPAPGAQSSTGLFGQSTANKPVTGLFGQSTSAPSANSGLFGQSSTTQTAQPSLFGSQAGTSTQQQAGSSLGGSTSNAAGGIGKTTKFTDLPDPAQKTIEQMDVWIKQQKEAGKGANTDLLGQVIWQTSGDVKAATEEYTALSQGLVAIRANLDQLRAQFITEEEDLRKVAEIWETFKSANGRPGSMRIAGHGEFPQDFFGRAARAMSERVQRYQKTIAQLQRHLTALTKERDVPTASAIGQTIQNHQNAILNLAGTLERLQTKMNHLRAIYAEAYRERTNSLRDPFDVAREEKGLPPVRS